MEEIRLQNITRRVEKDGNRNTNGPNENEWFLQVTADNQNDVNSMETH